MLRRVLDSPWLEIKFGVFLFAGWKRAILRLKLSCEAV